MPGLISRQLFLQVCLFLDLSAWSPDAAVCISLGRHSLWKARGIYLERSLWLDELGVQHISWTLLFTNLSRPVLKVIGTQQRQTKGKGNPQIPNHPLAPRERTHFCQGNWLTWYLPDTRLGVPLRAMDPEVLIKQQGGNQEADGTGGTIRIKASSWLDT